MAQRCEVCHTPNLHLPKNRGAQATAFLTKPIRAACGGCHNDIDFATGFSTGPEVNHPGGPQADDTQCMNCHIPQGEMPFDASIMGAHVVATDTAATYPQNPDTLLAGINLAITSVTNTSAGQKPTVELHCAGRQGQQYRRYPSLGFLQFTMAGPTTDYGYTSFGSDTASHARLRDRERHQGQPAVLAALALTPSPTPFRRAPQGLIPSVGKRATTSTVLAGTTAAQTVEYGAKNPVVNFSVDGSAVAPRRTVVAEANCNNCHVALSLHGTLRNNVEYCVLCHNPSNTDARRAPPPWLHPTKRCLRRASISIYWFTAFTMA